MNLYNYDKNTKEYLSTTIADADPAETKKQGKFIPLIPANATLIEPPTVEINQVAVFENNKWVVKADYRKNYVKVDDNFQVQEITTIGEQEGFYLVDKATGELIKENPNNFKIQDGEIVQKTKSEIEQQKIKARQTQFKKDFFLTSFGYIRRKVNMATGEIRDFLFDLLPAIEKSVSLGKPYPVIVYKQPDFTKEITTEYLVSLQEFKNATEQFCKECTLQIGTDFSGQPITLNEIKIL